MHHGGAVGAHLAVQRRRADLECQVPPITTEPVEVVRATTTAHRAQSGCTEGRGRDHQSGPLQKVDVFRLQAVEEIVELVPFFLQERTPEFSVEEPIVFFPVPQIMEEGVEVARFVSHERVQQRIVVQSDEFQKGVEVQRLWS